MAVCTRALGQCLVLLVTCVAQVSGQSSGAGGNPNDNDTCELLESTFVKDKCVAQFEQLQENGCREYCGSVEGQECRPDYIPCEEKSGLCDSGHKCCSNDTVKELVCGNSTHSSCQVDRICALLPFGHIRKEFKGCEGRNIVCCQAPCPTGEKSRRGGRYSEFLAECTRDKCDQKGDYPTLESRYVCPDAEDVCCLRDCKYLVRDLR